MAATWQISWLIVTEPFLGKIKPGMQEGKQIGQSSNLLKQKFLNLVNFQTTTITKRNLLSKYLTGLKLTEQKCLIIYEQKMFPFQKKDFCMMLTYSSFRQVDELT